MIKILIISTIIAVASSLSPDDESSGLCTKIGVLDLYLQGIWVPSNTCSAKRSCIVGTGSVSDVEVLGALAGESGSDEDYACAFIAFQSSGIKSCNYEYTRDTVDRRFQLFKDCVDEVNAINTNPGSEHTAGINYFCDMEPEERALAYGPVPC